MDQQNGPTSTRYNRSPRDGRHRSHRFLGANQFMPDLLALEGAEQQTALTHAWLRGEVAIPEIALKWPPPVHSGPRAGRLPRRAR
jgi:hypothetical protein